LAVGKWSLCIHKQELNADICLVEAPPVSQAGWFSLHHFIFSLSLVSIDGLNFLN
jgi:hypothetical protein